MPIRAARVVLPCRDLAPTLAFFTDLGFRIDAIHPADAPRAAELSGFGLALELDPDAPGTPATLRLRREGGGPVEARVAPNGTRVEIAPDDPPLALPPLAPALAVVPAGSGSGEGRAGMQYRDLLPDRQGGRFVASAIRIPRSGPVPDWVHHHRVRFQVLFCHRGRVRVVYEDQGPPFWMEAGDCVLQPPGIRHRVLEAEAGVEVIEVACPAEHETRADRALALPTAAVRPDRSFGGQRFLRSRDAERTWGPGPVPGTLAAGTGAAAASGGTVDVRLIRTAPPHAAPLSWGPHGAELRWWFFRRGTATLAAAGALVPLGPDAAVAIPPGTAHELREPSPDLEILEVEVP